MNATDKDLPGDIEALLPWHAAGTLSSHDSERVEDALARDPELARRYVMVRDELGETILLNETLGAPSARAMETLFKKIDAEPAHPMKSRLSLGARVTSFVAALSPRTLAYAGGVAVLAIVLQAGIIAGVMLNERAGTGSYQTASAPGAMAAGSYVMARFAAQASANEVTEFLEPNKLSVAGGPAPGGLYRLRVSDAKLTKEQVAGIARRLQQDKRIDLIVPTE
jgi:anti-sigma factor RsiW